MGLGKRGVWEGGVGEERVCERAGLEGERVWLEEEKGCEGTGGVGLEKGKGCVREIEVGLEGGGGVGGCRVGGGKGAYN